MAHPADNGLWWYICPAMNKDKVCRDPMHTEHRRFEFGGWHYIDQPPMKRPGIRKRAARVIPPDIEVPATPELDKLAESPLPVIEDFLEWASAKGIMLAEVIQFDNGDDWWMTKEALVPVRQSRIGLLYEFAGVDPAKIEDERRALLDMQHKLNERNHP